jgi:hypothetical protein
MHKHRGKHRHQQTTTTAAIAIFNNKTIMIVTEDVWEQNRLVQLSLLLRSQMKTQYLLPMHKNQRLIFIVREALAITRPRVAILL